MTCVKPNDSTRRACGAVLMLFTTSACMLPALAEDGASAKSATSTHIAKAKKAKRQKSAKPGATEVGKASYYGKGFQGKKTADGERFDKNEMVAAHPTLPLGSRVRVTNLENGKEKEVRINDRGPAEKYQEKGVIIDVSEQAAKELGFKHDGKASVKTEVVAQPENTGK